MDELLGIVKNLYPNSQKEIAAELYKIVGIRKRKPEKEDGWYKSINIYVTYPDAFEKNGKADLFTLSEKIEYIKNLGFNAIHILPFLDSSMSDGGFDIKKYLSVRDDLGGMNGIESVIAKSKENDINIFMDLILNHVSSSHQWFLKATAGDQYYRNYFIYQEDKPILLRKYKNNKGHWAEYLINGNKVSIRIIFPQIDSEIPHWFQGKDGYWYYHTFYESQPDLNWENFNVFIEFVEILRFWAKKGMNFRLDAISFIGKELSSGDIENNPKIHQILRAFNIILKMINPDFVFLAEVGQPLELIKNYFGTKNQEEVSMAYNFSLMQSIWYSFLTKNSEILKDTLDKTFKGIPAHSSWVNFLRNHDELTLEFMDKEMRNLIYSILSVRGADFRDGFGISGRTMDFVSQNENDLIFLYTVLASLPGSIALIYGDELGKTNSIDNKEFTLLDTREINRGKITNSELSDKKSQYIYSQLSKVFNKRVSISSFFETIPQVSSENDKLLLKYDLNGLKLNVKIDFEWS